MTAQSSLVFVLATMCAYTDICTKKIYNRVTYLTILIGVVISLFSSPSNLLQSLLGLTVGFGLFGLLRAFSGGMGAGDVKLMAAIGALKGLPFVLNCSWYTVIISGVGSILILAYQGRLVTTLKWVAHSMACVLIPNLHRPATLDTANDKIPYAPFICLGTYFCLWLEATQGPLSF